MKQIRLILVLAISVFVSQSTRADAFRLSQIVGYNTGNLGVSGTGASDGWENATANVVVTNGSGSLDGTALGLVASAGDKVSINATLNLSVRNLIAPNGTFPQTTDTNLYFSFLYRFNVGTDVSTNGQTVMQMNRANSGTGTPQHWNLMAKNVGGSTVQLGLAKAGAPSNVTNYAAPTINAGDTFFVVIRQHIIPGVQNDVYDLWINPPANTFFTNEANIPPSDVSVGALTTDGTEDASGTGPGRCVLASGANANFDEFRVGGTWADVTPYFGQCISAGVAVSPTSQTNSAEIGVTLRVIPLGTSPTFQWQQSTDGGTVWTPVPAATQSIFASPNLALSQNGIKYRAIVTAPCNGSSATSGVATITLIAPTVTPAGLVVDDLFNFPDPPFGPLRDDVPVSISNSVWRTANSASLGCNLAPPPFYMFATPAAGSSSLFLGYFTEPTNLPVHLAVGTGIRVTFPFNPVSFTSFTNNAGLRLGLFDYADGGTRLVTDSAAAGGSAGNGINVRGYMLNLDFGPTFTANSPLQLLVRNNLADVNLMGSVSDYISLGSGPAGGGYTGAQAFQAGTDYTLTFTVARTAVNSVDITTTIVGGGTNWSHSVTETNLAYHRFDAFGMRPNSLETSADMFTIPEFKVEVISVSPAPIPIGIEQSGTDVILTWSNPSFNLQAAPEATGTYTNVPGATSPYTTPLSGSRRFFRLVSP